MRHLFSKTISLWIIFQVYAIGCMVTLIQLFFKFLHRRCLKPLPVLYNTELNTDNVPQKKVAVVTGASSGIGQAVARKLSAMNYFVIAPIKQPPELPLEKVEYINMDLGSLTSVSAAASLINAKYHRIDLLVNCAGVMFIPYGCSEIGVENHFAINYLGHFQFTSLLMPLLLATSNPKLINITSSLHTMGSYDAIERAVKPNQRDFSPHLSYASSKLALVLFTYKLQRQSRLCAVAYDPGTVKTNLYESADPITSWFVRHFGNLFLRSPADAADDVINLIDAKSPAPFCLFSGWMRDFRSSSAASRNIELQDRLWDFSRELTKSPL